MLTSFVCSFEQKELKSIDKVPSFISFNKNPFIYCKVIASAVSSLLRFFFVRIDQILDFTRAKKCEFVID